MKTIVVSGLKPSGELHIGNYLGMLKNAVWLQESGKYTCLYFIADYHSLTVRYDPKEKREEIFTMAVDALSAGIDPKKSTIFIQSHIPEHANLAWIFNTIASMGTLERMVEYKEKVAEGQVPNLGLFDYPVLMAADILLYKAEKVPVGDDQRQHLELARDIARTFNKRFGKTFREPQAITTKAPRVMSLDDPKKKMSKTLPNGCLYLSDSPEVIRKKVKAATTDSFREIGYDPENRPGVSNLILIHSEFSGMTIPGVVKKFRGVGYGAFKESLAELLVGKLTPLQRRRRELMKDRKAVLRFLADGAARVSPVAKRTMDEVKRKVGLL
ncbi:tryptophan--tRNA ligase [Candidatus Wolfebacteria bacterium]|nr:tryptophan--tRNA ligase [Candidatus Wolfebacteria bacterium]